MRQVLINIILTRLNMEVSKEDIVTGMFHTICETLQISKLDAIHVLTTDLKGKSTKGMLNDSKPLKQHHLNPTHQETINLFAPKLVNTH
jgi:hypothetical protein